VLKRVVVTYSVKKVVL